MAVEGSKISADFRAAERIVDATTPRFGAKAGARKAGRAA
jgi:hypothetical protein